MTLRHTPGPWRPYKFGDVKSGNWYWSVTQSADDSARPAQLASVNHYASRDAEADARLIAAAPELLAMLETVLSAHDYDGAMTTGNAVLSPAIRGQIVRAIAKAKGGAA